jgi:hypothetical protein
MLDWPTFPERSSNSSPVHPTVTQRVASPQPTLVVVHHPESPIRRWMMRGAGLGGLALLAAIGWSMLDQDPPGSSRTAVDVASVDSQSPDAGGDPGAPAPTTAPEDACSGPN